MRSSVPRGAGGSPLDPADEGCLRHCEMTEMWSSVCGEGQNVGRLASLYRNPFPRPFSDVYFTGKTLFVW